MDSPQVDHAFKLLLIGDSGTGKSSLLVRFTDGVFDEDLGPTVGVDFKVKMLEVGDDKNCKLSIWDTAGQERFRTLTASYYRGAHGVIFMYDITREDTFTNIEGWLQELVQYSNGENVAKMLVGNKIDREDEREVSAEDAEKMAKKHNMMFIETSAKTDVGVKQAFEELVQKILDMPSTTEGTDGTKGVTLGDQPDEETSKSGGCC
ncbi:GTP-binding protein yptV3 [Sphaeroforma arctica JP610]|uniref:GTP-binding protein yptV3 n=1 Tax=Sphaeroforma arctica JP610 TaxID=667725 RepID=A0A0L0FS10_9EUKA|nr:GTP-binding protein yptV3 [Sphaeroforma arctica JP610]KNC78753.1 GTP-binding protein yptV3 [Sphaeroforma arctica JP610]|eukprot:XP_014152655.1 GTP-binding protein yptV3 [Sphaeroforma arctica JP610]